MQYGLRHYDTLQRLWQLVLVLSALILAYPASADYIDAAARLQPLKPGKIELDLLKSMDFWRQCQWMAVGPLGRVIVFLTLSAYYFWVLRALWLIIQWLGGWLVSRSLNGATGSLSAAAAGEPPRAAMRSEAILPVETLRRIAGPLPLRLLFRAHRRLYVLTSGVTRVLSSEALLQREARLEAMDWQLAHNTWEPYRSLVRILPALAVAQTGLVLYLALQPLLDGRQELQTIPAMVLISLIPVVQMIAFSIGLALARGLLERLEHYQLARLDAIFFDQILSRLPLHSADTLLLLNALDRHFQQLHAAIKRLEQKLER
ncbi:MAG: hypothetical protein AUK55_09525 [Syntrophobacteraceae bacterium CG2_30_61_12]|nr:MAG: hypothetical protein AUK55_09525 [Syntrophobacteraceae bacterium CG2_30_61_12]PIU32288.1 MAG: hypothetical protein COT06_03535 [Syntrophobacteraceae bacterium CG07_land_8_20_14_0_80_61_8]